MKKLFLLVWVCLFPILSQAQITLTGMGTRWSDDFSEWDIFTDDEESNGELTMRWQMQRDWSQWDYQIGNERGFIRISKKDDPSQWELRSYTNEVITIRRMWANDNREWRLTDNRRTLKFKTKWGNRFDEWVLREDHHGYFSVFSEWEGDPRDWVVVDEMDETISIHMKMAMMFIAVFNGSPKW